MMTQPLSMALYSLPSAFTAPISRDPYCSSEVSNVGIVMTSTLHMKKLRLHTGSSDSKFQGWHWGADLLDFPIIY